MTVSFVGRFKCKKEGCLFSPAPVAGWTTPGSCVCLQEPQFRKIDIEVKNNLSIARGEGIVGRSFQEPL